MKSDSALLNVAFPDESATYWITMFPAASRLEIRGRYPEARYFSFHSYDSLTRPTGGLADFEIDPVHGRNPFRRGATTGKSGRYRVTVEPTAAPVSPAANTLYAGATEEGVPNPTGLLIYRVYAADDPDDPRGSVPLPDISVHPLGGAPQPLSRCIPAPPPAGGDIAAALRNLEFPEALPRVIPYPPAENPPRWRPFRGFIGSGFFFSNRHIGAYGLLHISRQYGEVVVFRGRAPSFPDTAAGERPSARRQMRYWSICQNELVTQRYVACTADHETPLDRRRRFTVVISDPGDRPVNATAERGVAWLPWGGTYDGAVIYRHMLARDTFAHSWRAVPEGVDPAASMGAYYPRATYCTTADFEAGGWRACAAAAPR